MAKTLIPVAKTWKPDTEAHCALRDQDSVELAKGYIAAWAAKVEPGAQMLVARMKCALADGPCGCPEDSSFYMCTGPYPPVPMEIILKVLEQGAQGVELLALPAPEAVVGGGHVIFVEFVGPGTAKYVKKV